MVSFPLLRIPDLGLVFVVCRGWCSLLTQRAVVPLRPEQAVHYDDRWPLDRCRIWRVVSVEGKVDHIAAETTA